MYIFIPEYSFYPRAINRLWHVLSVHAAISFHLFKRHDEIVFASYLTVDDRTADLLDWLDVAEYRAALYSTG